MNKSFVKYALIFSGLLLSSSFDAHARCEIFLDKSFGGRSIVIEPNRSIGNLADVHYLGPPRGFQPPWPWPDIPSWDNWNDKVSSVKVTDGCILKGYLDKHYGRPRVAATITYDTEDVGENYNDEFSSVQCICRQINRAQCVAYTDSFQTGSAIIVAVGQTLDSLGDKNDRISSIETDEDCQLTVFRDPISSSGTGSRNQSAIFAGRADQLGVWNDEISALSCNCKTGNTCLQN